MAHTTSATAFLTIEKSFEYRGAREHWSNTYHLDLVPPTSAEWSSLAGQVQNYEAQFLTVDTQFEHHYGHEPGTPPVLVWEADPPPVGEGGPTGIYVPPTTAHKAPGDAACYVRYGTTQKSVLGKPIYLWNYYHDVWTGTTSDTLEATQKTQIEALAGLWVTGVFNGTRSYRKAGPRGAVAQDHHVGPYITTRTIRHRGRRHRWGKPASAPAGYRWILTNVPESIN